MATYNSVTFTVLLNDGILTLWQQEERVAITPIPNANYDDVQWMGLGNPTITLNTLIESEADLTALQASRGITKRSLTGVNGATYANTMLLKVTNARKSMGGYWTADLTFMREA
jgi:hypothetical protein